MNSLEPLELPSWEEEIRAFEQADAQNPPLQDAILFAGSSSITMWTSVAEDFSEYRVINRGFGGSIIADSTQFADRILIPCRPRLIMLYAGDNDLAGGLSPQQVEAEFRKFVATMHDALPQTFITYLSIKPSPSRWHLRAAAQQANRAIEAATHEDERLAFLDVASVMLGSDGRPRPDIFIEDDLHMNRRGYELWIPVIRAHLQNHPAVADLHHFSNRHPK
ncbi:MAG: hypothetical protein JWN98_503 [Abditibacteriota bacterium]|nr:hypothetical protein [Abditibacteriota bacterium]